jgi:hypothetical protein
MNHTLVAAIACLALFVGMSLVSTICYRIGRRRLQKEDTTPEVSGAIMGAVFALLGLLIAFTFSGAWSRFDARRQLIVQEANAIGTAYLRLDLLPVSVQAPLREEFLEYAASRAAFYDKLTDISADANELAKATRLQREIWTQAVAATDGPEHRSTRILLLSALNDMFDIVTTRSVAVRTHPPLIIYVTLFAISLACAGLTGYRASASEHPGHFYYILLSAVVACVLYVILDVEYPRYGLVRLDAANRVLVDLPQMMK